MAYSLTLQLPKPDERSVHIVFFSNISTRWSINKDSFNCNQINNLITQATSFIITCSVLYITTQALYIGLYPFILIVQWYYALQCHIAASYSSAHSMLVLWQLPVALHLVHWVRKTVVQLPVAMYYNFTLQLLAALHIVHQYVGSYL